MSLKYCTSCGTKHEYTLEIPKFCSNCGTPFSGIAQTKQIEGTVIKKNSSIVKQSTENDEEDAEKEVPQISEIQVEIEIDRTQKIQFGNAKQSMSFAREKQSKPLTVKDLETRLETLFERDRKEQKE